MASPRVRGINEQFYRARRFLQLARLCKKQESRFRYLIAAVYPARPITELMLESASRQELHAFKSKDSQKSRKDFEQVLEPKLPHYSLIERIRIHDFHRFGCIPPDSTSSEIFVGGPIRLVAKKGTSAVVISPKGPRLFQTGSSSAKGQRSLCAGDGLFFDEESEQYLSLEEILQEYLNAIPKVIAELESLKPAG